jgi:hypothetical protein
MAKHVGILLMRHFHEAVRQHRIEVADSEPHWLTSNQYREREDGGIELLPWNAHELMTHAREQSFRPVGMIVINDEGDYWDYVDENTLPEDDRDFALRVFHTHAHFWLLYLPRLTTTASKI